MSVLSFVLLTALALALTGTGIQQFIAGKDRLSAILGVAGLAVGIGTLYKTGITDFQFITFPGTTAFWVIVSAWILATGLGYLAVHGYNSTWSGWAIYPSAILSVIGAGFLILSGVVVSLWLSEFGPANPPINITKAFLQAKPWILGALTIILLVSTGWWIAAWRKFASFVKHQKLAGRVAIASVLAILVVSGLGHVATSKAATPPKATPIPLAENAPPTVAVAPPTQTPTSTSISPFTPTATLPPTIPPTVTPLPTFTNVPPVVIVDRYAGCPKNPLGYHPDHQTGNKVHLIWKIDPYPTQKDASGALIPESSKETCEYEAWFAHREYEVEIPEGRHAIVAFYDHGDDWDAQGYLIDECPEGYGARCEGVFVATSNFKLKAGALIHVYLSSPEHAINRFLGTVNTRTTDREWSFACEFLDYSQKFGAHDNRNINVPNWVPADAGSIFGHTGCVNYQGNPGELEINPLEAESSASSATSCEAPSDHVWLWTDSHWFYTSNSTPISFDLPSWISQVDYEDFNTGEDTLNATQTVLNAGTAHAYCK